MDPTYDINRDGRGEERRERERKRKRGEGREFVLCPRNKKRKIGAYGKWSVRSGRELWTGVV